MSELILHQYPMSPFAEKARLMMGLKQLHWRCVDIPQIMPKPDVVALTGGYRRTPLLQIGADVYCDTALIADVLEHLQPEPSLYPLLHKGMARVLAQWADSTLFWASATYTLQPKGIAAKFAAESPQTLQAFASDRKAMRTNMVQLRPADATSAYRSYLRRIASMLDQDFLLTEIPCVADLAVYHPLWFTRSSGPSVADIFNATPEVLAWMDRVAAVGHGQSTPMSSSDAIEVARNSDPLPIPEDEVFQDDHGIALGSRVTVAAESFGAETSEGVLRAATRTRLVIERTDQRAGLVHVHFPRVGYVLRAAQP